MNPPDKRTNAGPEILLVNPWIYDFAAYDLWAKPLGLLYIAAVLRANDYQVRLLDCLDRHNPGLLANHPGEGLGKEEDGRGKFRKEVVPKPEVYKNVPRRYGRYGMSQEVFLVTLKEMAPPAAILITSGMTYWYLGVFRAIRLLRNRFPETPILLGGIYATLCSEHARSYAGADLVIAGQGEVAALKAVDDICGRRSNAEIYDHLNDLPLPAFDLYARPVYACVLTSRGCPYRCSYCASRLLSGEYRRRDVDNVLAELEWLRRGLGVKNIAFYDDALLVDSDQHIKPILAGAIRLGLGWRFHTPNGLHAREVDGELAQLMLRSGVKTVRLSFDPAEEDRHEQMGPKVTRADLARAVESLEGAGYHRSEIGVYLLAGLPEQSYREVIAAVDFVASLGTRVQLALYSPIPGTAQWRRSVLDGREDLQADPLLHNNTIFPTNSPEMPPEKFEAIKKYVRAKNTSLSSSRR